MPGSALACLDSGSGETVEGSCEKALFATPERTAAAVSYVTAQLRLLADGTAFLRRSDPSYEAALTELRQAMELDRFGIVAHVLATREGCNSEHCGAFALLHDSSRIRAHLTERTYDLYVTRYVGGWPAVAASPSSSTAALPNNLPTNNVEASASRLPPDGMFLPSAASIPPDSVLNFAPANPRRETTGSTTPAAKQPTPPSRPAAQPKSNTAPRAQANPTAPRPTAAPAPSQ
jgi:hypothetical protein